MIDIIQIKFISNYVTLFKKYADRTEWDNNIFMTIYYKGLKDSVKDKLMQYGIDFRNLGDFIYIFIELDDKIFLRLVEK